MLRLSKLFPLALCIAHAAFAQAPDLVNSNATQIDTEAERNTWRETLNVPSIWTGQPYITTRIASFGTGGGGSGSAPIRVYGYGDSYTTGFQLPANVAVRGEMNLGVFGYVDNTSIVGVTKSTIDPLWVSGITWTHAAGSTAVLTNGAQGGQGGYIQGDRASIGYIKQPGGGSFDLEYQASPSATWTPMGAGTGKTFTVNASTDVFTSTGHGYSTGTPIRPSTTATLPGGLTAGVTYFVISIDANTYKVATTAANATAGTALDITTTGSGTHTSTTYASIGISAANATTIGAYDEFTLPSANSPFYILRLTNVTAGGVKRICTGIYNSDGGGGIMMHLGDLTGRSPLEYTINPAILNPIWLGLAPDMVLSCWREGSHEPGALPGADETQWAAGGAFDLFYTTTKAIRAATDWVLVGMHPSLVETDYPAVTRAQRDWALMRNESWFNPYPLFRSYAVANERLMMGDDKHLSPAGNYMRNYGLWKNQILGSFPLGATGGVGFGSPLIQASGGPGVVNDNVTFSPRSFAIRPNPGNTGDMQIWDQAHRTEEAYAMKMRATENSLIFKVQNTDTVDLNFRYFKPLYGIAFNKTLRTASFNTWHWEVANICDATSGPITATIGHSATLSGSAEGRVYWFKKIDATANAVTITPPSSQRSLGVTTNASPNISYNTNGAVPLAGQLVTGTNIPANSYVLSSPAPTATACTISNNATGPGSGITFTFTECIDGQATKVLSAQWQYVWLQSHLGTWIIIGGN